MNLKFKVKSSKLSGLVLIELVVALAILGVVVTAATVLFLTTMQGQLQVRGDVAVIEGLRTGMESMTREIRAGREFKYSEATHSATCGDASVQFTRTLEDNSTATIVYCRNAADGALMRSGDGGATWGRITSSSVTITQLTFQQVAGTGGRVAIAAKVRANQGRLGEFFFSTAIAPRNIVVAPGP
ncbi:hypothetical protein HYW67_01760 [Candidatus Parcubacteria bacterium]|nr:hypothetical protein [Candidatus Parcubacteria bacterium]